MSATRAGRERIELEDWMAGTADPVELVARLTALEHRAELDRRRPRLDEDGLLWCDKRWVVIPDTQLCIVELLLERPNALVRTATITTTYVRNGSSGHPASVRTMLNRLVRRFAQVGLTLHLVRGKGVIFEPPSH